MHSNTPLTQVQMVQPNISPSMLSSDFAKLAPEAQRMVDAGAHSLHLDVMDGISLNTGHFVPNLTLGAPIVKSLRKHTKAFLDCHLMVTNPEKYLESKSDGLKISVRRELICLLSILKLRRIRHL